jgi:hypothetical protein
MGENSSKTAAPAWRELSASFAGWGSYMALLAVYCLLYNGVVRSAPVQLLEGMAWSLREWGMWLLLSPLLCAALRRLGRTPAGAAPVLQLQYLAVYAGVLSVALACRVGLDVIEGARPWPSLVYFLPRHAVATAVVMLAWYAMQRCGTQADPAPAPVQVRLDPQSTLLVCRGQGECVVQVGSVDLVSAAGNYVDIRCGDTVYLLRSTLRELEQRLPEGHFVRVHRSHLVNTGSIERITHTAAGNGQVILRGGHAVPMSKSCRARLKAGGQVQPAAR